MRTVETREIDEFYKKCGVEGSSSNYVRTRINTGTMGNKLNTGNLFGGIENKVRWTNSAVKQSR